MNDEERKIVDNFKAIQPALQAWGAHVDDVLSNVVLSEMLTQGFVKMLPKARLKEQRSYLFKVLYRKRIYDDPLTQIEDKVATRVVLLKSNEIEIAARLILAYQGWNAKMTKDIKDLIEDQPKIFDYQSCHVVVWPTESYTATAVPREWLTCEIQIRTLLQHAFAEVSHDSTYKGPYRNDAEILRHLAKSMALMESTDDYFSKIFGLMSDEKREFSIFLKELIGMYKGFYPDFDKTQLNYDINDRLFELLLTHPITLHELEAFIQKETKVLTRGLQIKNGLLFTQPAILIVVYYLFRNRPFLKENWPLNQESLKSVYRAFNISFNDY